jgi:hypothetical protein
MAEFPWQSHSRAGASATKRRPSNKTTKTEPNLARNRKFESSSLQRGVCELRTMSACYKQPFAATHRNNQRRSLGGELAWIA